MIIEGLFNLFYTLITVVFSWINLPSLPDGVLSVMDQIVNLLQGSLSILGFFVDIDYIKVLLPIVLIVVNFDKAYKLVMFVLRKIPFIGVK